MRVGQVGPCKTTLVIWPLSQDHSCRGGRTEDFTWWLTTADGHVGEATLAAVGRKMGLGTGRRRCRGGMLGNSNGLPGHPFCGGQPHSSSGLQGSGCAFSSTDIRAQVSSSAASGHWDPVPLHVTRCPCVLSCVYESPQGVPFESKLGPPLAQM